MQDAKPNFESLSVALQRLSPLDAEVIRLRHELRMTNSDVAASLDVQAGVASRLYVRALRRLKQRIAENESAFVPFDNVTSYAIEFAS